MRCCDLPQDLVADGVPERVVDVLEVVEVEQDEARTRGRFRRREVSSQATEQPVAVAQAGQVVVRGVVGLSGGPALMR